MSFQITQIVMLEGARNPSKESSTHRGTSNVQDMGLKNVKNNAF